MKILITGGAGFVGSHLCDRYTGNGNTVVCLDNFINGSLGNIRHLLGRPGFKLIPGDIRDFDLVEKIARDVDYIIHLAAQIHVDRSVVEPKLTYDINVAGTQNVLEAARMYDVKKVLHASTSEVYGTAEYSPMDERHPLNAPHPYGASKTAADRLCYAYQRTYGMSICVLRPFNIYGPRQKDSGYGGAISIFTKRVLNGMPPVIFGSGEQTRDYTYIDDTVNAYDTVLRHRGMIQEPVNFGTGREVRILDLANMIIKLCGKSGEMRPVHAEERPGEVQRLIADNNYAIKLGWEPKYTLEQGLRKFIDWYRNYRSEEWARPQPLLLAR